ncbi:MAG: hypothetical protein AAFX06_12460 [Planctomycetota bacterium]
MKLLRSPPIEHSETDFKVAIVTGLSDPKSTQLSHDQHRFLDAMPIEERWKIRHNFPFLPTTESRRRPSIIWASWNNGWQFARARSNDYRNLSKPHWQALCDSTERLFLITGSCGYQLIDAMEACKNVPKVHVLALGPVRRGECRFEATKILGRRDWIARWFTPHCDRTVAGVGHLDYWNHDTVTGIAANWLLDKLSESSGPAVTFPQPV